MDHADHIQKEIDEKIWGPSSLESHSPSLVELQSGCAAEKESDGVVDIRVFVSSTFTDFFAEREFLVKFVFPRLREWCESKGLHLTEVDLRWGVPDSSTVDLTLLSCLGEIDRCIEQNIRPFFVNMLGNRYGWVPDISSISHSIKSDYNWVEGASVTHMEILHGAYRSSNPNALFLFRTNCHINDLPPEFIEKYVDSDMYSKASMSALKQNIRKRFENTGQVISYDVKFAGVDDGVVSLPKVKFDGLNEFGDAVLDFLKKAIENQYLSSKKEDDNQSIYSSLLETKRFLSRVQKTFFSRKQWLILGRDEELKIITDWLFPPTPSECEYSALRSLNSSHPFIVFGDRKVGKSTMMSMGSLLHDSFRYSTVLYSLQAEEKVNAWVDFNEQNLLGMRRKHLVAMLHLQICLDMGNDHIYSKLHEMTKCLESFAQVECEAIMQLSADMMDRKMFRSDISDSNPVVIIIDEADELQDSCCDNTVSFLTFPLPSCVKCIMSTSSERFFSMVQSLHDKARHDENPSLDLDENGEAIASGSSKTMLNPWTILRCLDKQVIERVIEKKLARFNKTLDPDQLNSLLSNTSCENLEWVEYACEEIRIFGAFETLSKHIKSLPSSIEELLLMRLKSNEVTAQSIGRSSAYLELFRQSLQFLLVCESGLEESELRILLVQSSYDVLPPLLLDYSVWSVVHLLLKPFISTTHFFANGTCRFVIKSSSVRQALLKHFSLSIGSGLCNMMKLDPTSKEIVRKLANMFESSSNPSRKYSDYPRMLIVSREFGRLKQYLTEGQFEKCPYTIKFHIRRALRCNAPIPSQPCHPLALRMCINCSMKSTLNSKRLNRMSCFCCRSQIYSAFKSIGGKHFVEVNPLESVAYMCRFHSPQSYSNVSNTRQPCVLCKHPTDENFSFSVVICRDCKSSGLGQKKCSCVFMKDNDS